jgi:hypothetical protein
LVALYYVGMAAALFDVAFKRVQQSAQLNVVWIELGRRHQSSLELLDVRDGAFIIVRHATSLALARNDLQPRQADVRSDGGEDRRRWAARQVRVPQTSRVLWQRAKLFASVSGTILYEFSTRARTGSDPSF